MTLKELCASHLITKNEGDKLSDALTHIKSLMKQQAIIEIPDLVQVIPWTTIILDKITLVWKGFSIKFTVFLTWPGRILIRLDHTPSALDPLLMPGQWLSWSETQPNLVII